MLSLGGSYLPLDFQTAGVFQFGCYLAAHLTLASGVSSSLPAGMPASLVVLGG